MEAIWRRLDDVNLKLREELVVLMTLMVLFPSFGTQRRILERRKDLFMEIVKKDLRQEALRLKAEQDQQTQGHLAVNVTREDSRRGKRGKVWCEHCLRFVTTRNPQSCWNKHGNPDSPRHRALSALSLKASCRRSFLTISIKIPFDVPEFFFGSRKMEREP